MAAKRHKHEFTALWWHLGKYGRQDVHLHSCFDRDCDRVLVGDGRECDGKTESHWRTTLDEHNELLLVREPQRAETGTLHVNAKTHALLKAQAARENTTIGDVVGRAIDEYLAAHRDEIEDGFDHAREVLGV